MKIVLLLFSQFETLDAFGPAEVLGRLPGCQIVYASVQGGICRSAQGVPVMTVPLSEAEGEVLLLPGGMGTRPLAEDQNFLDILARQGAKAQYCLSVCTGSALLARCGLLDGRRATSNKKSFAWVKKQGENVCWQPAARWVEDGKFFTSSGISAGMDMALGFVARLYGRQQALAIAKDMEYLWNEDPHRDPFARED